MYLNHIIGGIGMAVVNFIGMHNDHENTKAYNDGIAKCHKQIQASYIKAEGSSSGLTIENWA
jgi:hypothetical protein